MLPVETTDMELLVVIWAWAVTLTFTFLAIYPLVPGIVLPQYPHTLKFVCVVLAIISWIVVGTQYL